MLCLGYNVTKVEVPRGVPPTNFQISPNYECCMQFFGKKGSLQFLKSTVLIIVEDRPPQKDVGMLDRALSEVGDCWPMFIKLPAPAPSLSILGLVTLLGIR